MKKAFLILLLVIIAVVLVVVIINGIIDGNSVSAPLPISPNISSELKLVLSDKYILFE